MGVVILNEDLSQRIDQKIHEPLLERSYQVVSEKGKLRWLVYENGELMKSYDVEPNTNAFERGLKKVLTWLPIEWLL